MLCCIMKQPSERLPKTLVITTFRETISAHEVPSQFNSLLTTFNLGYIASSQPYSDLNLLAKPLPFNLHLPFYLLINPYQYLHLSANPSERVTTPPRIQSRPPLPESITTQRDKITLNVYSTDCNLLHTSNREAPPPLIRHHSILIIPYKSLNQTC